MKKNELGRAAKRIEAMGMHVTGTRHYDGGGYGLDAVDPITGYPLVFDSVEQIDGKEQELAFQRKTLNAYE